MKGQAAWPFRTFVFRLLLHPVLRVVLSADESGGVLLLQTTEIEMQPHRGSLSNVYQACGSKTRFSPIRLLFMKEACEAVREGGCLRKAGLAGSVDLAEAHVSPLRTAVSHKIVPIATLVTEEVAVLRI